ncbi:MAG: arginine N-succinyltransferase [Desulfobacteraceae bacterium]|nr:arginine N-succinyltransferase [Desulfobacteraceae bacterium]
MDEQRQAPGRLADQRPKSRSRLKVIAILAAVALLSAIGTAVAIRYVFFPSEFTPVTLSPKEEKVLTQKINRLNTASLKQTPQGPARDQKSPLTPESYTEDPGSRQIIFSQREFNALIAKNTNLADKLAFDFSEDMASMKLLIPLDPEFPLLGGKTIKITAGVELGYANAKPVVKIRGMSIWGVPLPNAWMGNLKNVDLVREFGNEKGFWSTFAAGVEEFRVQDGHLRIRLKP